jgi:hypothetical protein
MRRGFWSYSMVALALGLACDGEGVTDPALRVPTLSIVSGGGDNQSGPAGSTLPLPVIVQVTGVSGSANGQILDFVVTSGGGRVFANVVMTGTPKTGPYSKLTGIAENTWTLGDSTGPQTIEARLIDPSTGATLTQAIFHATASPASSPTLKIISGDKQTGVAGVGLRDSAKVRVIDKLGNPLAGIHVAFSVVTGGGTSTTGVVSGQDGIASARWFLGRAVGTNTLTAFLGSDPASAGASPVTFTATGVPGAAAQLVATSGNSQHGALGSTLPIPPAVQVRDVNDNGVAGVAVTFTVTGGGGTMAGITSVTTLSDTSGKASVGWTLGSAPGPNTLRATALGLTGSPVIFGATSYTPLYVANQDANSITVYEAEATGNLISVRTISGPSTRLSLPANIVRDSQGQLYVTNYTGNSVTIYAADADGNAAPVRTIGGSNTGFTRPFALTRDVAGQLYVYDYASQSITIFAANATGNASPLRTISGGNTGLAGVSGLQVSATGEIYAADQNAGNIKIFGAGADGDIAPVRTIGGPNTFFLQPTALVLDAEGQLYVSTFTGNSVVVFAPGANGDVSPVRIINGTNTRFRSPTGLALDGAGNIYVANYVGQSITVYAPGLSGNAAPTREIIGANTGLTSPGWMTF